MSHAQELCTNEKLTYKLFEMTVVTLHNRTGNYFLCLFSMRYRKKNENKEASLHEIIHWLVDHKTLRLMTAKS